MKIVILGAGAMGSIYAALMAEAGNEVWVIDPWQAHTDTIRNNGLRVEGASGDRTVQNIRVAKHIEEASLADLYIIATKAAAVGDAARSLLPVLTADAVVLTIQNGLGSGERIARHLPIEQVLLGVAEGFGASVQGPGHVRHTAMKMIRIGSMIGNNDKRPENIAQVWRNAGFNAEAYADIEQLIWEKFICNVAYSAPCTVFNKTVKELMEDPHGLEVSQTCAREAWAVAVAKKINLTFSDPVEYVTAFGLKVGNARPSLLLDHLAERPSEIDAINGMVPVVAKEAGLDAPYNQVLSHIVRSRESLWHTQ